MLKLKLGRRGWGQGGEMNQALYAHMNNKRKMKKKKVETTVKQKHIFFTFISIY
jgi:hypothetical protein